MLRNPKQPFVECAAFVVMGGRRTFAAMRANARREDQIATHPRS